jgi:hypothetical protein
MTAKLYGKSPLRVQQLHESQARLGRPQNKMLKPSRTRWIGYADPLGRLNEQYTSVVDHTAVTALSKQSNAEAKKKNLQQSSPCSDRPFFFHSYACRSTVHAHDENTHFAAAITRFVRGGLG